MTARPVARAVAERSSGASTSESVTGDRYRGQRRSARARDDRGAALAAGPSSRVGGRAQRVAQLGRALVTRVAGRSARARAITRSSSVVGSGSPPVGRSPVSSSVSTTPSEYTSLRRVGGEPCPCSGREVADGAEHHAGLGERLARGRLRDAEVGDLHAARRA